MERLRRIGHLQALDYSLKRWTAPTGYVEGDAVTVDNNAIEKQIPP
jgi:hypothetical protein